MFKLNQEVRRSPKYWKGDTTTYVVREIKGGLIYVTPKGKKTEMNFFTGKQVPIKPMPYQTNELIAA